MEINETLVEATKKRCPDVTVYQSSGNLLVLSVEFRTIMDYPTSVSDPFAPLGLLL